MSSKREEERNEKIIRGLMKLPPNRKCINCNSQGPQYVCTNFWTFVCTTCSGIHREFTHRVKSVSMAKFTKEEVDALQRGGNQRAREIFLKGWDMQHMRLPNGSNADRIRQFIKIVYVDKKYAGRRTTDKPSINTESLLTHEEYQRRASSYHSFSQSPPYEYQYEDRRYGKQFGICARRPGSDRGCYEEKIDFSLSGTGDPFRYDGRSPNSRDAGYCSPPLREMIVENAPPQMLSRQSEANVRMNLDGIMHPQRTTSTGSFGSFESNSMSHKSVDSGGLSDVLVEPVHSTENHRASALPSSTQSPASLHAPNNQPSSTTLQQKPSRVSFSENEGWARFDLPHRGGAASKTNVGVSALNFPDDAASKGTENASTSMQNNSQWFSVQRSIAPAPFTPTAGPWHASLCDNKSSSDQKSSQFWKAFDDSTRNMPHALFGSLPQNKNSQVPVSKSKPGDLHVGLKFPEGEATQAKKSINPFDLPYEPDLEANNSFSDMSSLEAALSNPLLPTDYINGLAQPPLHQNSATTFGPSLAEGLSYMEGQAPSAQLPNLPSQGPVAPFHCNPFA